MRTPDDIERAIRATMATRASRAADRDRQAVNIRRALAEVERIEGLMARDLDTIETLYTELDEALAQAAANIADTIVRT